MTTINTQVTTDLPQVGYRFAVIIYTAGSPNNTEIMFKEVTGLKMERSIVSDGVMISVEDKIPLQTLVLKRGIFTAKSDLANDHTVEASFWNTRLLRKDIMVCTLDFDNKVVSKWIISNAYLESWEWDGFNADSNDLLVETMTFKYSKISYELE